MSSEGIETAAQLGVLGLDPLAFLNCRDSFERNLMLKVAECMARYQEIRDTNLANRIGKAVMG